MSDYNQTYHSEIENSARQSAAVVIKVLHDMFKPNSVVDVGCGRGTWLQEWQKSGVKDFLGIDGGHQDKNKLLIPVQNFQEYDLNKPFQQDRRFDIATCFEVVEHLRPTSADIIINTLTQLSDIIIFSAAIPNQGGFKHINEQWPDYWAKKFESNGYVFTDGLRWKILSNTQVSWWYRQNSFVAIRKDIYEKSFQHLPLFSPEFYVMHKMVYKVSTSFLQRVFFGLEQFLYNNFHSFYHKILPTAKKLLNRP